MGHLIEAYQAEILKLRGQNFNVRLGLDDIDILDEALENVWATETEERGVDSLLRLHPSTDNLKLAQLVSLKVNGLREELLMGS